MRLLGEILKEKKMKKNFKEDLKKIVATGRTELSFKRDEFESYEEWKSRILDYNPIEVGQAKLLKEKYNIDTGEFPIELELDWISNLYDSTYIIVNRDIARTLYNSKEPKKIYFSLDFDECGPYVNKAIICCEGLEIPILNLVNQVFLDKLQELQNKIKDAYQKIEEWKKANISYKSEELLLDIYLGQLKDLISKESFTMVDQEVRNSKEVPCIKELYKQR